MAPFAELWCKQYAQLTQQCLNASGRNACIVCASVKAEKSKERVAVSNEKLNS